MKSKNNNPDFWPLMGKLWQIALKQCCPACEKEKMFSNRVSSETVETCPNCGYSYKNDDSADGPAVFLIFVLGFTLVPLALWIGMLVDWPLWLHGVIWTFVLVIASIALLRPIKACVIYLQYIYMDD